MNRTASRHQAPSHRQDAGTLTGVRPLLRATIRQDARNIAPWVVLTSVLSVSSILIYLWLFPDPADRIGLSATLGANPALSLIFGPARDLMTDDGFNAWRAGQLGAFFAALMAILIVVRNSRAHEDSGQAELFASGVMARSARLAVAVIMAALASLALGVVSFTLTVLVGGGVLPTLILSASYVASGLMFAGVAAVAAQLGADSRAAASLAVAILGVLYVVRGYIDSAGLDPWVSWLTPLGWLAHTAPATENNPWPLLLALAFAVVLVLIAFGLENRRDFGRGLIAGRHGPERAGLAGSVWGLAVQLHRGALMSWGIAFVALGVLFGTLITAIGELIAGNPLIVEMFAGGKADPSSLGFAFLIMLLELVAIIAAVAGVQIVMRIHAEEVDYRVEPLLAGSLRRATYLASNAVVAFLAPAGGMMLAGTALGIVAHRKEPAIAAGDIIAQSAATIPAVWVLVALALAAVGAKPSRRLIGWGGVVATFGLTVLGPTFKLPDWALDISPLRHVPAVTSAVPDWSGMVWLLGIATVLTVVAFAGFRRRDVG